MGFDFGMVQWLAHAADQRHPRAQYAVGQAAFAILIFRSFLLEQRKRVGRVFVEEAGLEREGAMKTCALHLLAEIFAIEELGLQALLGLGRQAFVKWLAIRNRA